MKIKISKTYHFNTVEVVYDVNSQIDETANALSYLKYLLSAMDGEDVPGHAPKPNTPKMAQKKANTGLCTEKQRELLQRLYGDDLEVDFSVLPFHDASQLINEWFEIQRNNKN